MRYVVDLESPDMKAVLDALRARIIALTAHHTELRQKQRGLVSDYTVEVGRNIKALERGLAALVDAANRATPDHATPRADPVNQSLQDFADERPVHRTVAARPASARRYRGSWQKP